MRLPDAVRVTFNRSTPQFDEYNSFARELIFCARKGEVLCAGAGVALLELAAGGGVGAGLSVCACADSTPPNTLASRMPRCFFMVRFTQFLIWLRPFARELGMGIFNALLMIWLRSGRSL